MTRKLAARYTIERISTPAKLHRYLTVLDDGDFGWGAPALPIMVFKTARAAELFRLFRMGDHADDARVVRHAVH